MQTMWKYARRWLPLAIVALVAGSAGFLLGRQQRAPAAPAVQRPVDDSSFAAGDWGKLRYWNTVTEVPEEMLGAIAPQEEGNVQWYFGKTQPAEVMSLLLDCGLSKDGAGQLVGIGRKGEDGAFVIPRP